MAVLMIAAAGATGRVMTAGPTGNPAAVAGTGAQAHRGTLLRQLLTRDVEDMVAGGTASHTIGAMVIDVDVGGTTAAQVLWTTGAGATRSASRSIEGGAAMDAASMASRTAGWEPKILGGGTTAPTLAHLMAVAETTAHTRQSNGCAGLEVSDTLRSELSVGTPALWAAPWSDSWLSLARCESTNLDNVHNRHSDQEVRGVDRRGLCPSCDMSLARPRRGSAVE